MKYISFCSLVMLAGAPAIRSRPSLDLGNAMTSLMDLAPVRMAISRSSPKAIPACGGHPNSSALNIIFIYYFVVLPAAIKISNRH